MPNVRPYAPDLEDSNESHWNTTLGEMARHLRHVQFYYMLACFGLLMAIMLPRDSSLHKASIQLDEVIRFQSEAGDQPLWELAGTAPPSWSSDHKPQMAILFHLDEVNAGGPKKSRAYVSFVYENEILKGDWGLAAKKGLTDFRAIENHEEFSHLWDALARDDAYVRVRSYGDAAYFYNSEKKTTATANPISVEYVTDASSVKRIHDEVFSLGGTSRFTPTRAEFVNREHEIDGQKYEKVLKLKRAIFSGSAELILPVQVEPARIPILSRLLDGTESKYKYLAANDYWLVHEELADWTLSGNMNKLELLAMRSLLDSSQASQGESFPIFGLSIPYRFVFKYGLAALVVIQVFFWGHLRAFRKLADDAVVHVWAPWLPLYDNLVSRILTVASIAVIPAIVIARLVAAAEYAASSIAIAALGIFVTALVLFEFIQIWRSRRAGCKTVSTSAVQRAA